MTPSPRWQLAVLAFVSACKLLHREAPDAGTTSTSSTTTVAESDPGLGGTPSATASASAVASADPPIEDAAASTPDAGVDPRIAARQQALREAAEFGMLGLIDGDGSAPLAPWGTEPGTIGTSHIGHNSMKSPSVRMGALSVNGRLPPEVIQRIVRQNFGRFRLCYENGLRLNPSLQGRVSTKFVIARDGSVTSTQDAGSDMPDQNVTSCVVRGFGNLSFPQPEAGIVVVTAPVIFSPSS